MSKRIAYRLWPALLAIGFYLILATVSFAQVSSPSSPTADVNPLTFHSQSLMVQVTVFSDAKKRLDRQSLVKLSSQRDKRVTWQTTSSTSEASFGDLEFGKYDIDISAVGYLPVHKEAEVIDAFHPVRLEVILQRDPEAIDLTARDSLMTPKLRKQTNRALHELKSGNLKEAEKQLDAARALAPSNSDVNYLTGYLSFQRKDYEQAQAYLQRAVTFDPHNVQALTLLGRVMLQRQDYDKARAALEQAVAADQDYWMAHHLLAVAYLRQNRNEDARAQAQMAIEKGKGDATPAQLTLGEALANMGHLQEGIAQLNAFLQAAPDTPVAAQVRSMIASLEKEAANPTPNRRAAPPNPDTVLDASLPTLSVKTWVPRGIDEAQPSVAAGVTCPYDHVIDMTGQRVKELVDDISKFAAIEDMMHERIDKEGNPTTREIRKFDYVASISEQKPGVLAVDEFRDDRYGIEDLPDQIVTKGFAALALVFHPDMRDNFAMTCEGLGELHGQATWLVHFRQRDDRPSRLQDYIVGDRVYPVKMKGRAWISADKFEIVRIESELVSPIPEIQLLTEHQVAEYGPVLFAKKNVELWLPKSADLYLDYRKQRFHRRHSFDHYMLFSVESEDKVRQTKGDPHGPGSNFPRKKRKHWHA